MSKRMYHKHFATGPSDKDHKVKTLCGDAWQLDCVTEFEKVTCPTCSAKRAKQLLASHPGLKLGKFVCDRYSPYRSVYSIFLNDQMVGFIAMKQGWGNSWRIKCIGLAYDGTPKPADLPPSVKSMPYYSKEAALLDVPTLVQQHKLPTLEQVKANAASQEERRKAKEEAEKAKAVAQRQAKDEVINGLQSIVDQKELSVRQLNALGVAMAIAKDAALYHFK